MEDWDLSRSRPASSFASITTSQKEVRASHASAPPRTIAFRLELSTRGRRCRPPPERHGDAPSKLGTPPPMC